MRLIWRLGWRAVHVGKINYKPRSISDSLVFQRKCLTRVFFMKYNKWNSFYSNFVFYIICPGRISGVASHGHGASSLSLWGEEWLVLGCHYKSIMWHLYKQHERSSVFIINAHQASAMARWEDSLDLLSALETNQAAMQGVLGGAAARWFSSTGAMLLTGTSKHGHVWNPCVGPPVCCTVGNQLQPLTIFIFS